MIYYSRLNYLEVYKVVWINLTFTSCSISDAYTLVHH